MRASIRGSMRNVMVTDSDDSLAPATAVSISRRSGLFSAQKSASAVSLSKIGTSSHLAIARTKFNHGWTRMDTDEKLGRHELHELSLIRAANNRPFRIFLFWPYPCSSLFICGCLHSHSLRQRLVHFSLVKKSFFGLEGPGVQHADLFSVGAIDAENADPAGGHTDVEKSCLDRKPRRIGQQLDRERVLERFFDFLQRQRTIEIEGRIIPIKLHTIGLIVYVTPMQCLYIVFTHWPGRVSRGILRKNGTLTTNAHGWTRMEDKSPTPNAKSQENPKHGGVLKPDRKSV